MTRTRCHRAPVRVLYIETPVNVGGSVISLYELVRGLDRSRYDPLVLFYGSNPYRQKLQRIGVHVLTLPPSKIGGTWPAVASAKEGHSRRDIAASLGRFSSRLAKAYRLAKEAYVVARYDWPLARHVACLLKKQGIDLVHHNNSLPGNRATIMAARLSGISQVCHVRNFREFSWIDRYYARFVDAFIYISAAVEQRYHELGIAPHKGQVVHNPFDAQIWRTPAASGHNGRAAELRAELGTEFGFKDRDRIISNVGRLDWWKGQDYFLQALAEIVRLEPNVRALLVGAPDSTPAGHAHHQKLKRMVIELGLSQLVTFTGFRSDVPKLMAASDIVIHSASEPEPFGRVVVEAMLAGRPVVATGAGGVLDIVEDQITGLLVQPKDADAMAGAILRLLRNPEQAEEMGRRAQQRAEECFSVKQHVTEIEKVYDRILAYQADSSPHPCGERG